MTGEHEASAFWLERPGHGTLRRQPVPLCQPGAVTVATRWTGISAGTERTVFAGRVPESQHQAMRAPLQEGDFPAPVKYGYSAVGVVEDGPAALAGQSVFALHPHQSRFTVPTDAVVPIPDNVPPSRAVLAANMETALNAVWDAEVGASGTGGDTVTVIGAGVVGCLVAYLARHHCGADVELVDILPQRADIAAALDIPFRLSAEATSERPLIFHTSGHPGGLVHALSLAAFEGRIFELSWYGDRSVPLPLGEAFHSRRLSLVSSQVGHVATPRRATTSYRDRLSQAIALLADDRLDALIERDIAFADLPATMAALVDDATPVLCVRVCYPANE